MILRLSRIFRYWESTSVVLLLGFIRSEKFVQIGSQVSSGSPCGIILRIAMSTGLMCLDCSGVTTENSAICVCFLIRYGDSSVLVTLTAILLSFMVYIEWQVSKLSVAVNFSTGVTVPVVFHSDGRSMKAVIVFVVAGGIVWASLAKIGWGFPVVSIEAVLTCIVKCRKCMSRKSMTTPLFLIKCDPLIGFVNFFKTTKWSVNKVLSPISNLCLAVANGVSH